MTMRLGHVNSWFVEVTGDHSGAFFRYENMLLQKPSARSSQKKMRTSLANPSSFPLISHLTPSQEQNYFLVNATIKSEPPDTTVEELPSPVFQSNPLEFHNSTIDKKPSSQADMSYTCMTSNTQVVPDEPSMAVAQSNYTAVMEEMWNDANIDSNENDNNDEKVLVLHLCMCTVCTNCYFRYSRCLVPDPTGLNQALFHYILVSVCSLSNFAMDFSLFFYCVLPAVFACTAHICMAKLQHFFSFPFLFSLC